MDEYFDALRRGPRLPARRRRRGPQGRLHRDDPRPPPLPARPDQRQPAAPRDGRADGAERPDPGLARPTSSRSRCSASTGRWRPRACAAGCCCRCTTSSCSRWRRGEREAVEALVRREMGARLRAARAAGRVGRLRPHLARRRALTGAARPPPDLRTHRARPLTVRIGITPRVPGLPLPTYGRFVHHPRGRPDSRASASPPPACCRPGSRPAGAARGHAGGPRGAVLRRADRRHRAHGERRPAAIVGDRRRTSAWTARTRRSPALSRSRTRSPARAPALTAAAACRSGCPGRRCRPGS